MNALSWEPLTKPGYILLEARADARTYLIQKKDMVGHYRLFFRRTDKEEFRTILVGLSMKDCTDYAESWELGQS